MSEKTMVKFFKFDFKSNYLYFRGIVNAMFPNAVPENYKTVMFSAYFKNGELVIISEFMTNFRTYLYILSLEEESHFKELHKNHVENFEPFYKQYEKFVKYHIDKMGILETEEITNDVLIGVVNKLYEELDKEVGV